MHENVVFDLYVIVRNISEAKKIVFKEKESEQHYNHIANAWKRPNIRLQ